MLNERLLTIEWQQRELPEADHADAGAWLLISTSDAADLLADARDRRVESCTTRNARPCSGRRTPTTVPPPSVLRGQLGAGGFAGVVVVTGPQNGNPDERVRPRGRRVRVRIWCASPAN